MVTVTGYFKEHYNSYPLPYLDNVLFTIESNSDFKQEKESKVKSSSGREKYYDKTDISIYDISGVITIIK